MAGPAAAATPNPNTPETVSSGINAAQLPGATVFGDTPASTPETVPFILRERNLGSLQARAVTGSRNYLSLSQFASVYGQTAANISALTSYLAHFGIKTDVYADNVDVVATGTAGEFDSALSVTQHQYHVPALPGSGGLSAVPAQNVHGTAKSPLLPYRLANFVLTILGLSNYGPYAIHAAHVNTHYVKPQQGSSSCLALTGLAGACNLPSNFAANYGLTGLYSHGANGAGQTLAIVTLAAVDPGAPEYFWSNIAHVPSTGRTFTVQDIDGGPGAPSNTGGSGETDLDLEQSGALAAGANVIDYQAPNTDPGFADAFFTAASQNTASTISSSWGESETILAASILAGQEPATYLQAFNEAFLEMAAQGQSGFLSAGDSGDSGAYDASGDLGTTNLSVDTSADSPYITAAGGTTLPLDRHDHRSGRFGHGYGAEPARLGLGLPLAGHREDQRHHRVPGRAGEHRRHRRRLQQGRGIAALPAVPAGRAHLPRRAVPDADRLPDDRARTDRADRLDLQPRPGRHQRHG